MPVTSAPADTTAGAPTEIAVDPAPSGSSGSGSIVDWIVLWLLSGAVAGFGAAVVAHRRSPA